MPELGRLFVALPVSQSLLRLPNDVPSSLSEVLRELGNLGSGVTPTQTHQLHVTLKFMGDTRLKLVDQIIARLANVAQKHRPFVWRIAGIGAFPEMSRPSVLWAGLDPVEPCLRLAADVSSALEPLGFLPEARAFRPHVTLAYLKTKPSGEFIELVRRFDGHEFGSDSIDRMLLMESRLHPEGPEYIELAAVRLSGE